jgi:UDPglucose 6-dehydrogenase
MKMLIVGYGFVGTATEYLFKKTKAEIHIHDTVKGSTEFCDEDMFDYIFLCVPTPTGEDGKLDISILTDAYEQWKWRGQIVIRSTIGPDQVDSFPNAIMMPEFLREKHWKEDVDDPLLPIIVSDYETVKSFDDLFPRKRVYYLRPKESMMYKLARNSVLAMRVSMSNHLKDICLEHGVDWNSIAYMFESEGAIGYSHWKVPGPDGAPGFGGKCLPKDLTHMASLCYTKDNIMTTALLDNLVRRVKWGIDEQSY